MKIGVRFVRAFASVNIYNFVMFKLLRKTIKGLSPVKRLFILLFSIAMAVLAIGSIYKVLEFEINDPFVKIMFVVLIVLNFAVFYYLSIFDILFYEIPAKISMIFPIGILILNVIFGVFVGFTASYAFWYGNTTTVVNNILGGLVAAIVIGILVAITRGKGIGEGDIWVVAALGLFIGFEKILAGFYIAIFTGLIAGILYSIKLRRFKGVPIPFVPFLVIGFLAAFAFNLDYGILFGI